MDLLRRPDGGVRAYDDDFVGPYTREFLHSGTPSATAKQKREPLGPLCFLPVTFLLFATARLPQPPSASISFASALPRWLTPSFSSAVATPKLFPRSALQKSGS